MPASLRPLRPYLECTAFVVGWLALEFYFLTPLQGQLLGLPLIVLFQRTVARRPLSALWVFAPRTLRLDARVLGLAATLAAGCIALLWLTRDHPVAGLGNRWGLGAMALAGCLPAAFALVQQDGTALRRGLGLAIAAGAFRVAWHAAWLGSEHGWLVPADKLAGFATLWLCEFTALFLVDEVAFRGLLDPHLSRAGAGRVHAVGSAVFLSILWALWHLHAYNPHTATFGGLFLEISPFAYMQVVLGTLLSFCARRTGTLVAPAAAHAFCNAYVLALR